jgi:hypothetical protein
MNLPVDHAPALPDVESIVFKTLKDLGGISVFAYDAGAEWPFVAETVSVQVDVHASNKKRARDRAYEARQRLLRLPMDPTTQVGQTRVLSGPQWLPEPDGAPRYTIRVGVSVRAFRT